MSEKGCLPLETSSIRAVIILKSKVKYVCLYLTSSSTFTVTFHGNASSDVALVLTF